MNAGINAAKLNASVGCIQSVASIGCIIVACIQSVSSAINYHIKATIDAGIHAAKLCWMQTNWCQFMHPKCFKFLPILVYSKNNAY